MNQAKQKPGNKIGFEFERLRMNLPVHLRKEFEELDKEYK